MGGADWWTLLFLAFRPFCLSGLGSSTVTRQMSQEVKLEERQGGLRSPSFSSFPAENQDSPLPALHPRFIWRVSCGAGSGPRVLSYFSIFLQHNFPMVSNNTHYSEVGDESHDGGKHNSWWWGEPTPWASPRSSQWSLQNWGPSEVIESNLRNVSMENVYLNGNFLNAYPRGEEHCIFSAEYW